MGTPSVTTMRQTAAVLPIARLISASALAALPHHASISGSASQRRMRKRSSASAGRKLTATSLVIMCDRRMVVSSR